MFGVTIAMCNNDQFTDVVEHIKYPNGVIVIDNYLYFTPTLENKCYRFRMDRSDAKKELATKVPGGDNLLLSNGKLYTTSHPKLLKFMKVF